MVICCSNNKNDERKEYEIWGLQATRQNYAEILLEILNEGVITGATCENSKETHILDLAHQKKQLRNLISAFVK